MTAANKRAASALVALAVLLAGCGEDEPASETTTTTGPSGLEAVDRDLVRDSEAAIQQYCRRTAIAVAGAGRRPSVREQARALTAVDDLVALAAQNPEATVKPRVDLRLFLGDVAENLEGSNCDPAVLARLEAGLASLPGP